MDDAQEEYRKYAQPILPNLVRLCEAFREHNTKGVNCPVIWSSWSRQYDDGASNAMDRWYGNKGTGRKENAIYVFGGEAALEPLAEIAPSKTERDEFFYHSKMLDMFWCFRADGKSFLDEKLKEYGVDTVVITGLWTDECIIATAYAALMRGYDVIVVSDAVATVTAHHEAALTIMNATCGVVLTTDEVVDYMKNKFTLGKAGAVKGDPARGSDHPDGRRND